MRGLFIAAVLPLVPDRRGGTDTDQRGTAAAEGGLAAFFGYGEEQDEDFEAQWADESRRSEEIVADCMAAEGFEYIPVDHKAGTVVYAEAEDLTDEERARTHGYGITRWVDEETGLRGGSRVRGPQLGARGGDERIRAGTPTTRPCTAAPLLGAVVGLLAGLYPSLRAASLEPVEALRSKA